MKKARFAAILLPVALLVSLFASTVFAQEPAPQPRYTDFSSIYAGIYLEDNGLYAIEGGAAAPNTQKEVHITLTLEEIQGDEWVVVPGCTWTASGMVSAHTGANRSLNPGVYRAHTEAKVYRDGVLLESAEAYSYITRVD